MSYHPIRSRKVVLVDILFASTHILVRRIRGLFLAETSVIKFIGVELLFGLRCTRERFQKSRYFHVERMEWSVIYRFLLQLPTYQGHMC